MPTPEAASGEDSAAADSPGGVSSCETNPLRFKIGSLANPEVASQAKPKPTLPEASPEVQQALEEAKAQKKLGEKKFPPPNIRQQLPPDLEKELEDALGGMSVDDMLAGEGGGQQLAEGAGVTGTVVSTHRDNVFVDLGQQRQGVASLSGFPEPPEAGSELEFVVRRYNADDSMYEVRVPGAATEVGDWSEVEEGLVVQATVKGHNKGGLECSVNNLRAFMPMSQISLYRVDNAEEYVGQSFTAVVTECKPERKNLVISRRAVLEREREEAKNELLEQISVGQLCEGVVRSLKPFGAFVDLGNGVDGLIHISQMSWDHIEHPQDLLQIGQRVKVKVVKFDKDTGKIGLSYRDAGDNPWSNVETKYPVGTQVSGTVSKITDFGAFVRLESGVEGLIHISELAHQHVHRVTDVVSQGQQVEAKILSVDAQAQRIGLSLKALVEKPKPVDGKKQKEDEELDKLEAEASKSKSRKRRPDHLKGGVGGPSGGEKFGLKW